METTSLSIGDKGRNTTVLDIRWSIQYAKYVSIILTAVGLLGNILSLIVLLLSPKRSNASRLYLSFLAVTDSLVLISGTITYGDLSRNNIICKANYATYALKNFSSYIVAVIAIQRFVMVNMPFKGKEYDKTKYGIYHLFSAFIFAFSSNVYAVVSLDIIDGRCNIKPDNRVLFTYSYLILNYLCSEVGVGLFVMVLTILTVQRLVKSNKMGVSKNGKGETKLTKMLIVLAATFVILRLPGTIVWLISYVPYGLLKNPLDDTYYKLRISDIIFGTVTTSNFAVNFIIYITFWPAFRQRFVNVFSCPDKNMLQGTSAEGSN